MTYCLETSTLPEKGQLSERSVVKYRIALLASVVLCGPYRIIIIPGSATREENNQFEDYIVLKNGKRLHMPNRMRLGTAKDGARIAWWEGFSGETKTGYKYDAYGELITRDGKSYYSEIVTGGKTGKILRETPKIPCKQT